jgi:hypothetical protein
VSSSLGHAQDGLRSCTVLSCTVIIHIQPPCFRLTRYRCRVMACAGRYHAVKCDHHHLLPPMHLEHSSSQLLSPAQIGRDQMTWCPAYLRSASPRCLVVQSFFQAVLLGQHDRMQDSEDMLLLDDCLSWWFFFKSLSTLIPLASKTKRFVSLSQLGICPPISPIHIFSPIRHTHQEKLLRMRYVSSVEIYIIGVTQVKNTNETTKERKERKERKDNSQIRCILPHLPLPFLGIEGELKPLHTYVTQPRQM